MRAQRSKLEDGQETPEALGRRFGKRCKTEGNGSFFEEGEMDRSFFRLDPSSPLYGEKISCPEAGCGTGGAFEGNRFIDCRDAVKDR